MNAFERLYTLNEEQKQAYRDWVKKNKSIPMKKTIEKQCLWVLGRTGTQYYVKSKIDERTIWLNNIGQLFNLIADIGVHITNLSLLKGAYEIVNYYSLGKEALFELRALGLYVKLFDTFSVIKVDDMEKYVMKSVLVEKVTVIKKHSCYTILLKNNKDIILVSDLILRIATDVTLGGLCVKHIRIENFDLSDIVSLKGFFYGCDLTETILLKNFDTRHIIDFSYMFSSCLVLSHVTVEEIKTDNAKTLESMFSECKNIEYLDLTHFKVDKVINFISMFSDCVKLKELKLSKRTNKELACRTDSMFKNCPELKF